MTIRRLWLPLLALIVSSPEMIRAAGAPYAAPPIRFERNDGQFASPVKFGSRVGNLRFFVTPQELVVLTPSNQKSKDVLRMWLDGARSQAVVEGEGQLQGHTNYFRGNDRSQWRENVPSFAKATIREAYPGIDVVYYGNASQQLEFDFVVAPGADPASVALRFSGAQPRIDRSGDLILRRSEDLRLARPIAYQQIDGRRKNVAARFVRRGPSYGFALGTYDRALPLVIDPILLYGTYLGGSGGENPRDLAADANGNVAIFGTTESPNFPVTNATTRKGGSDYFVTKYDPAGNVIFSTILGGTGLNAEILAGGIDLDAQGNAYITGSTDATDYPTANALYASCPGCPDDSAVLTKLSPTGTIVYSTYLGAPTGRTQGQDVAVDPSGSAYVYGITSEGAPESRLGFPLVNAYQSAALIPGAGCCSTSLFLTRFNAAGSAITYSTLFGSDSSGGATDPSSVAVNGTGHAWISGHTDVYKPIGTQFPGEYSYVTTPGAIRTSAQAEGLATTDAYVARFDTNASGAASLIYSTLLGGATNSEYLGARAGDEGSDAIAVDASGTVYVTGTTYSTDFPVTAGVIGPVLTGGNTTDWFISRINTTGTGLMYSTYFGSPNGGSDNGLGIAVDSAGNALVTGTMVSGVTTVRPLSGQNQAPSGIPSLVASINPTATAVNFSSYLDLDEALAIDTDSCGNMFLVGHAGLSATSASLVKNASQATSGGSTEAFVLRIDVRNGDANHDCAVTVADIFYTVNFLFSGGAEPFGVVDANRDGVVTVTDVFFLVNFLFAGGTAPSND